MGLDKDYSPDFSQGSTYNTDLPISVDPSNIGVTDSSPSFVGPIYNLQDPITDYVPASTGGQFSGKIYYPSALTLSGDYDIVYKSWVENYVTNNVSIDFDTLFDARFSTKALSGLAAKPHSDLTSVLGDGSYHLSLTQRNNVILPASGSQNGYLTSTDWTTFNNKLSSLTAGTGLNYNAGTISLVLGSIDHNSLLNYSTDRHLLRNDSAADVNSLWSASKTKAYTDAAIAGITLPTDFVAASTGGQFSGIIYYNDLKTISSNTHIPHKKYVDDAIDTDITTYAGVLAGSGAGSVKSILSTLNLTDLGTRNHNDLQNLNAGDYLHLSAAQKTIATQAASTTLSGYLTSTDWNTFNNKLGAFSTILSTGITEFLSYSAGVLSYNPAYLDHNGLLNYDANRHALLDDAQTTTSNVWSASYVAGLLATQNVRIFTIRLNSGATVSQRLVGLVEGVDYPTGWVLTDYSTSLIITHNLDTLVASVKVFSKNNTTSDVVELQGNIAYATLTNDYGTGYNAIRLDSLATIVTELYIKILI